MGNTVRIRSTRLVWSNRSAVNVNRKSKCTGVVLRSTTVISQQQTHATNQPSQASPEAYILPIPPQRQLPPKDQANNINPPTRNDQHDQPVSNKKMQPQSHRIPRPHPTPSPAPPSPGPLLRAVRSPRSRARGLWNTAMYSAVLYCDRNAENGSAEQGCWPAL